MNYTDKDFAKVSLNEKSLDLSPFLRFCRELKKIYPQNAKEIGHKKIDDIPIDKEIKDSMMNFKKDLISVLCNTEVKFYPLFIELSLFDPEDKTGKTFYSLLFSDNEEALTSYYTQMGCNLNKRGFSKRPRSPIIPNRHLHEYIYYSLHIEEADNANLHFNKINPDSTWMTLGHYDIDDAKEAVFAETKEELSRSIMGFLQDISDDSISFLSVKDGKYPYNYAALIPLFRPAATFRGDIERIYNGGGLFIYGNLPEINKEDRLVLEIQSNLTKSIFQTSHSQIAFDEKDSFINNLELKLIHQIKNKVSHGLTEKLTTLKDTIQCDDESRKYISETIDFTRGLISKLTTYLNSFRNLLLQSVKNKVSVKEAKTTIEKRAQLLGLPIKFKANAVLDNLVIKIDEFIIQVIFEEFLENASREYNRKINQNQKKEIEITIYIEEQKPIISLSVLSKNIKFLDEENLSDFGRYPMANTTSTGLGLFFINKVLEQSGATRYDDGRFIFPHNTGSGSIIEIKLPI